MIPAVIIARWFSVSAAKHVDGEVIDRDVI